MTLQNFLSKQNRLRLISFDQQHVFDFENSKMISAPRKEQMSSEKGVFLTTRVYQFLLKIQEYDGQVNNY